MTEEWTPGSLRELAFGYMSSGVLLAAAELDIFSTLDREPASAPKLAAMLQADLRATTILADALAALELLEKREDIYSLAPGVADALTHDGSDNQLPFMQHHANSLRSWGRLAEVTQSGRPAVAGPSIRGPEADHVAYQEIMDVNARHAPEVIAALGAFEFNHFLDIGCGPGTWAISLLHAVPGAHATLYDRPDVLPITRKHVEAAGLSSRVTFLEGDYLGDDPLPEGFDLVWISAVAHLNSRQQNRELFAKAHASLRTGGQLMIRDIVMDDARAAPFFGAMFSVTMLVRTETGGTYSFREFEEDLAVAGFERAELFCGERPMDSVIRARRMDVPPK